MIDRELIKRAISEDLDGGVDITSMATLAADAKVSAQFVSRKDGVVAGIDMAIATLSEVGVTDATALVKDGDHIKSGTVLIKVSGNARGILLAERTALNFLGHLSGIATLTRTWVDAVAGTNCIIRDTRKTTPGMRLLEKYAVRMGGGTNHRMSLSDAALIKDNHIAAAGGVAQAFSKVREKFPTSEIEIEVDTLDQLREVLPLKPDVVLLDINLPGKDGLQLARELSEKTDVGIILVTARNDEIDRIVGLEIGADDYVTKPFGLEELLLRVKAILRRANVAIAKGADVSCGPIIIDEDSHTVKFSGELVELSPTEFRLLQVLIENKNRVLSKSFLLDEVWGITFESESTVADTYISYLRKKLHRDGFEGIKTIRGVGFVIQDPK